MIYLLKRERKNPLERTPQKKLSVPPQLIAITFILSPASTPSRGYTTYSLANHNSRVYKYQYYYYYYMQHNTMHDNNYLHVETTIHYAHTVEI